jgi:hypothetical protein
MPGQATGQELSFAQVSGRHLRPSAAPLVYDHSLPAFTHSCSGDSGCSARQIVVLAVDRHWLATPRAMHKVTWSAPFFAYKKRELVASPSVSVRSRPGSGTTLTHVPHHQPHTRACRTLRQDSAPQSPPSGNLPHPLPRLSPPVTRHTPCSCAHPHACADFPVVYRFVDG